MADYKALLERHLAAINKGDGEAALKDFDKGVTFWHNTDGTQLNYETMKMMTGWLKANLKEYDYKLRKVSPTPEGFVAETVLSGPRADGSPFRVFVCMVAQVNKEGKIAQMNEYADSATSA